MLRALNNFALRFWGTQTVDDRMYRLLIEDFGMEIELDDNEARMAVQLCPNVACVQVVTRNQTVPYRSRPLLQRLENAILYSCYLLTPRTPGVLVQWTGEGGVTPGLATFKDCHGCTALHIAASSMYSALARNTDVGLWEMFVQDLICNGADFVQRWNGKTPLLVALLEEMSLPKSKATKRFLYCWANALQGAGVDLVAYGRLEDRIWRSLATSDLFEKRLGFVVVRLLFGSEPMDWSVKMADVTEIPIYELQLPPGSWRSSANLPKEILWKPSWKEEMEGHWVHIDSVWVCSEPFDIRHGQVPRDEPFDGLMQSCQDDHGPIALRARPPAGETGAQRRSASQPSPIKRRRRAYLEWPLHRARL